MVASHSCVARLQMSPVIKSRSDSVREKAGDDRAIVGAASMWLP